jgi:hypothetical protein
MSQRRNRLVAAPLIAVLGLQGNSGLKHPADPPALIHESPYFVRNRHG